MKHSVQLYVIPKDRVPLGPPDPPRGMEVDAASVDAARAALRERVQQEGLLLRSVCSSAQGLVAYAEEV